MCRVFPPNVLQGELSAVCRLPAVVCGLTPPSATPPQRVETQSKDAAAAAAEAAAALAKAVKEKERTTGERDRFSTSLEKRSKELEAAVAERKAVERQLVDSTSAQQDLARQLQATVASVAELKVRRLRWLRLVVLWVGWRGPGFGAADCRPAGYDYASCLRPTPSCTGCSLCAGGGGCPRS